MGFHGLTLEERNRLAVELLPVVKINAAKLIKKLPPSIHFEDLVQEGSVALLEALDRYDIVRGVKIKTYVQLRVWGAMIDYLRNVDHLSRKQRQQWKETHDESFIDDSAPIESYEGTAHETDFRLSEICEKDFQGLSPKESEVMHLLYSQGYMQVEVAKELGLNESTVSRIHTEVLLKLKRKWIARRMRETVQN